MMRELDKLHIENSRLLALRDRVRRAVRLLCGSPPTTPKPSNATGLSTPVNPDLLAQISVVLEANDEILNDLQEELNWLESRFDIPQDDQGFTSQGIAGR